MVKFLTMPALVTLLIVANSAAFARGMGASSFAPGHERRVPGTQGASGNAPGHLFLSTGRHSLPGHPGASGFAPGRQFHRR
jgi:hypothetical protein